MEYEAKQRQKCSRTAFEALAQDLKQWFERFPQLKEYYPRFDSVTAVRMLQLTDKDLLNEFKMESNVDRQ